MSKQNYTITELTKELNQARHNIRRRLNELGIKALNEDSRDYKTEPLEYDYQALIKLSKEFDVELSYNNSNNNVKGVTTNVQVEHKLIEQLQEDLKHERERTANLERLLDQQQQLSLSDRNKIKALEVELEETSEESLKEEKKEIINKNKWYKFWK